MTFSPKTHSQNLRTLSQKIDRWLTQGEHQKIFDILESSHEFSKYTSPDQQRILLHGGAMAYVYVGALNKAKSYYLQALKLGENAALKRDLACCYYQLNEIDLWRKTYKELEATLSQETQNIGTKELFDSLLILGKFYEEEGDIAQALHFYERCYGQASGIQAKNSLFLIRVLPQILRVKALYDKRSERLSPLYLELISFKPEQIPEDLRIEIEHSLMLAELSLLGPSHSWTRVKWALAQDRFTQDDHRLFYFDFVEEALLAQMPLPDEANTSLNDSWTLTTQEEQIKRFLLEPDDVEIDWLNRLAPRLSWACCLRGLILFMALSKDKALNEETKRKIQLILGILPVESRKFWHNKLDSFFEQEDLTITVHAQSKKLSFQNKEIDLSRKKGMLQIMNQLSDKPQASIDLLIDQLWQTSYSPEHFHRLRMTVHRLNHLLFELTSIQKVLELDSDQLQIHSGIQIAPH